LAAKIIEVLGNNNIPPTKISGLVFDTTSVNSGIHNGVVTRLEENYKTSFLQLACRHHMSELWGSAACKEVYGPTKSPKETVFTRFASLWENIDKAEREIPQITGRYLNRLQNETTQFLKEFLASPNENASIRKDYKELAQLSLLLLGEKEVVDVGMIAPGACHHARWMASMIYTIKIALFRDQLVDAFDKAFLDNVVELAIFLSLFYVRYWLTCTSPADAPQNDLKLLCLLEEASVKLPTAGMKAMAKASLEKFNNHLWYLTERLVPFALFSSRVSNVDKEEMKNQLKKYHMSTDLSASLNLQQCMPEKDKFSGTPLKTFVGPDSFTFFMKFGHSAYPSFLDQPVDKWLTDETYLSLMKSVNQTKVVNDASERALGLITDFHKGIITTSEDQKQYIYQVVRHMRKVNKDQAKSTERITKKVGKSVSYSETIKKL